MPFALQSLETTARSPGSDPSKFCSSTAGLLCQVLSRVVEGEVRVQSGRDEDNGGDERLYSGITG